MIPLGEFNSHLGIFRGTSGGSSDDEQGSGGWLGGSSVPSGCSKVSEKPCYCHR